MEDTQQLPPVIIDYLTRVFAHIGEQFEDFQYSEHEQVQFLDPEEIFRFWEIADDERLREFIEKGLSRTLGWILGEAEAAWRKSMGIEEEEEEEEEEFEAYCQRAVEILRQLPPGWNALHWATGLFELADIRDVPEMTNGQMARALSGLRFFGLSKIADAYYHVHQAGLEYQSPPEFTENDNIWSYHRIEHYKQSLWDAFETILPYNPDHLWAELSHSVRRQYRDFLMS